MVGLVENVLKGINAAPDSAVEEEVSVGNEWGTHLHLRGFNHVGKTLEAMEQWWPES